MTVTRGGRTGRPRCSPERAQDRRAHGGHRDAPWDGAAQSIQSLRTRRCREFFVAFGGAPGAAIRGFLTYSSPFFLSVWPRSCRAAHRSQYAASLGAGVQLRTGRINRRPSARHIVPAPCHAVPRGTVRTQCRLQWVDVCHNACTCAFRPPRPVAPPAPVARKLAAPFRVSAAVKNAGRLGLRAPCALGIARRFSPQCRHKVRSGAGRAVNCD